MDKIPLLADGLKLMLATQLYVEGAVRPHISVTVVFDAMAVQHGCDKEESGQASGQGTVSS